MRPSWLGMRFLVWISGKQLGKAQEHIVLQACYLVGHSTGFLSWIEKAFYDITQTHIVTLLRLCFPSKHDKCKTPIVNANFCVFWNISIKMSMDVTVFLSNHIWKCWFWAQKGKHKHTLNFNKNVLMKGLIQTWFDFLICKFLFITGLEHRNLNCSITAISWYLYHICTIL